MKNIFKRDRHKDIKGQGYTVRFIAESEELMQRLEDSQIMLLTDEQIHIIDLAVDYFHKGLTEYLLDPGKTDGSKVWARLKLQQLKPILQDFEQQT